MNVSVVDLSENQKKLQVQIPAEKVQKEIEGKYREMSRQVKIKGFRPGKVPRNILKSYYGKTVEHEVSSQFIQETFPEALKETDLKPLVEADVSETHFEDNGSFTYTAIVDVCPPFEIEGYRGLTITKPPVEVADEDVSAEVERLREKHASLRTPETERPAQDGDVLVVDFTPSIDGKVFEKGKSSDYMMELGKKSIHPDFDSNLVGHAVGETVSFEVDFPENAPRRELAGKKVLFEVTVKEVKEKLLPDLDDEFAKTVDGRFDSLDALRQTIREELQKFAEQRIASDVQQQITEQLLSKVTLELSPKVIDREVDRMLGNLLHQFESQGLKMDPSRFNTPEIRADYRPQARSNIVRRLILEKIAKLENLELTDEEIDQIYQEVARYARMDVATVKEEFADSAIVEQSKDSKIQEKVLRFLEAEAVPGEISQEEKSETTQE